MGKVRLEVLPWISDAFGDKESGQIVFNEEAEEGDTVGDVISKLVAEHQTSGDIIFDAKSRKLSGYVAITLNDRLLEALKGLDTNVKDGDTIKLFPAIPIIIGG